MVVIKEYSQIFNFILIFVFFTLLRVVSTTNTAQAGDIVHFPMDKIRKSGSKQIQAEHSPVISLTSTTSTASTTCSSLLDTHQNQTQNPIQSQEMDPPNPNAGAGSSANAKPSSVDSLTQALQIKNPTVDHKQGSVKTSPSHLDSRKPLSLLKKFMKFKDFFSFGLQQKKSDNNIHHHRERDPIANATLHHHNSSSSSSSSSSTEKSRAFVKTRSGPQRTSSPSTSSPTSKTTLNSNIFLHPEWYKKFELGNMVGNQVVISAHTAPGTKIHPNDEILSFIFEGSKISEEKHQSALTKLTPDEFFDISRDLAAYEKSPQSGMTVIEPRALQILNTLAHLSELSSITLIDKFNSFTKRQDDRRSIASLLHEYYQLTMKLRHFDTGLSHSFTTLIDAYFIRFQLDIENIDELKADSIKEVQKNILSADYPLEASNDFIDFKYNELKLNLEKFWHIAHRIVELEKLLASSPELNNFGIPRFRFQSLQSVTQFNFSFNLLKSLPKHVQMQYGIRPEALFSHLDPMNFLKNSI